MERSFLRGDEEFKVSAEVDGEQLRLLPGDPDGVERSFQWEELTPGEYLLRDGDRQHRMVVAASGRERWIWIDGHIHHLTVATGGPRGQAEAEGSLAAPMTGTVLKVMVAAGEPVRKKQALVVLEAMKLQYEIAAPRDGVVATVNCDEGALVQGGVPLVTLVPLEPDGGESP